VTKTEAGVVQELVGVVWISVTAKQQQHYKEVREKVETYICSQDQQR